VSHLFPREICHIFYLIFFVASIFMSIVRRFFSTWFFTDGFLFPIKELGFLTNPDHWVSVFYATSS
jgi:hypothetical protein